MNTFNQFLIDSTGAFLQGELEVIDQTLHLPDVAVKWHEDVLPRTDISLADDWASWTNSNYGRTGGTSATAKSWGAKRANATPSVTLDIAKSQQELFPWELAVDWTIWELESAQKLGRPVDTQKVLALGELWNQDIDFMVYLGDTDLGVTGLFNSDAKIVTNNNVVAGTADSLGYTPTGSWSSATAAQILADVRNFEIQYYASTGYSVPATKLLLSPAVYTILLQPIVIGGVGYDSILEYIARNSFCMVNTGAKLDIQPRKFLDPNNNSIGANRAVLYTLWVLWVKSLLLILTLSYLAY